MVGFEYFRNRRRLKSHLGLTTRLVFVGRFAEVIDWFAWIRRLTLKFRGKCAAINIKNKENRLAERIRIVHGQHT